MKIDVEGFEDRVFFGGNELFTKQYVKLVMFERLGRTNLQNIQRFLEERDYVVFRVNPDLSITADKSAVFEPLINLFAAPSNIYLSFQK